MSAMGQAALFAQRTVARSSFALGFTLLAAGAPIAAAQTGTVLGTVSDRGTGQPLDAARAQVVGTTIAGASDTRGAFVLRGVRPGTYSVRVSRIGFRPEVASVTLGGNDTARVTFALTQSAVELDQVVVTGTGGAVEKRKIGSSMGVVDMTQVQEQMAVTDIGQALASKVTGLRSVSVGGGAGAARDLRIRGTASFSLSQRPVIYIDGVRVDTRATEWTNATGISNKLACCSFAGGTSTDRLSDLNPDDIERVEVLKGAAAATLYGSEATNGVIQIFTKRGKNESAPSWSMSATTGIDRLRPNLPTKFFPKFVGTDGTRARDANTLIGSGPYQNYDVSVQGGGTRSTYFASGGYMDEEGSIQPNYQKKGNFRLNLNFLPTDKWSIEGRSMLTRNDIAEEQAGNNWTALLGNAMNGNPRSATAQRPFGEAWVPVSDIKKMQTYSDATRWTGGMTLNFTPIPSFTHRFTFGLDDTNEQKSRFFPWDGNYGPAGVTNGQRDLGYRFYYSYTADYLGQYTFRLPKNIGSDFSFGMQALKESERFNIAVGNTFAGPGVSAVSSAAVTTGGEAYSEKATIGYLAQDRLSFGQKLYATLGVRVDGNSAFGDNYGFKTYPKADVAWVLSEYGFMPQWVSSLKVRAAVGQAGKAPGAFDKFQTFTARSVLTGTPGVVPDNPGNADLRPETTTEREAGFESGFFHDRLGVEASIYHAITKDAIVPKSLAPSAGFQSAQSVNIGALENHGWEASVNYLAIARGQFDWTTNVRLDGNHNRVTDLGGVTLAGTTIQVGYPVQAIWTLPMTGYSATTNGVNGRAPNFTRGSTPVYMGPPLPTFNASFGNTVRFGALQFYALVTMERGAVFQNSDRPYRVRQGGSDEYLQFLNADGTTTFQADSVFNYWSLFDAVDSRNNVRLREISLSYTIPERLLSRTNLGRTQLTLSGQNVMWWDHCHCVDPNMNWAGGDSFGIANGFLAQPAPRQYRLAIRTRF
ncbi:MAG TPA: TonB-dependent receptor [Gemmatimonadaceae bacterium]